MLLNNIYHQILCVDFEPTGYPLSSCVCLFVCLSVTRRHYIDTAASIELFFCVRDSIDSFRRRVGRGYFEDAWKKLLPWNLCQIAHGEPRRNFSKSRVRKKATVTQASFLEGNNRIIPFITTQDRPRQACVPKTTRISSAVLTQYRHVTDTHRQTQARSYYPRTRVKTFLA